MEQWEIEGAAEYLLRIGGQETDVPPNLREMANRILGPDAIVQVRAAGLPGDAALMRVSNRHYIHVKSWLTVERKRFAIAHELAEWDLLTRGFHSERIEQIANAIAAAIVAPRPAFYKEIMSRPEAVSQTFRIDEICKERRVREVG